MRKRLMLFAVFLILIGISVAAIIFPGFQAATINGTIDTGIGISPADVTIINSKLDAIKASADLAVTNAEAAVIAAQLAADKVDLFNSAEVYFFPASSNITVTLTSGNTNTWGSWNEIIDSTSVTLTSKFATGAGYISDLSIFETSAVDKIYLIELAYGAAKTTLGRTSFHTSDKEAMIKSRKVSVGEIVYARVMCSGANGATCKVGFRYFYE